MAKKHRDHFVPRLLIRQFLNERGRAFCFDKRERRIPDRIHGNQPRDILHQKGYYTDTLGSLDDELYRHIENEFAPHLLAMVRDIRSAILRPGVTAALQDWVAAQLSRTQLIQLMVTSYLKHRRSEGAAKDPTRSGFLNSMRLHEYRRELNEIRGCTWRAYWADEHEKGQFVLSDQAAIKTPEAWATGTMYIVPLSPTLIVAAGPERGHDALRDPSRNILPLGLNGVAMSYAYRFVFSPRLPELESLSSMFEVTDDPEHQRWMKHASEPCFGLEQSVRDFCDDDTSRGGPAEER